MGKRISNGSRLLARYEVPKVKKKNIYELFGTELLITGAYREIAEEHLKSWNTLHVYLTSNRCNEVDLMKLIVIEREGKSRPQLISRMHSALTSIKRKSQQRELGI